MCYYFSSFSSGEICDTILNANNFISKSQVLPQEVFFCCPLSRGRADMGSVWAGSALNLLTAPLWGNQFTLESKLCTQFLLLSSITLC